MEREGMLYEIRETIVRADQAFRHRVASLLPALSAFFAWLLSLKTLIKATVLVAIAASVIAVIPGDDELIIIRREEVKDPNNVSTSIVRAGNNLARARSELANWLGRSFAAEQTISGIEESATGNQLKDFVDAALKYEYKNETTTFSFTVNLTRLAQAYITRYLSSSTAVHVVVDDWRANEAKQHDLNLTLMARSAQLFPTQSRNDLERNVSGYFIEKIYDAGADCAVSFCARDTPADKKDVEVLAGSIDALGPLRNAGACETIDDERECLAELRKKVAPMTEETAREGGAAANFILFLVELRTLKMQITGPGASPDLAESLEAAHSRLLRAKSGSDFFKRLVGDADRFDTFLVRNEYGDLGLSTTFLNNYESFVSGRKAMQTLAYADAVTHFDKVLPSAPAWFQSYIRLFRNYAEVLNDEENFELATKALNELRDLKSDLIAPWIQQASVGGRIQIYGERFAGRLTPAQRSLLADEAEKAWGAAISQSSNDADRFGYRVEAARTRAAFGTPEIAKSAATEIDELARDITRQTKSLANPDDKKQWRMAFAALSTWYARKNDFDAAKIWAERGFEAYPRNICATNISADFKTMRETDPGGFNNWIGEMRAKYKPDC